MNSKTKPEDPTLLQERYRAHQYSVQQKADLQELLDLAEIVSNDLFDFQNKLDLIRQKVMTLNRLVATVKKDQQNS